MRATYFDPLNSLLDRDDLLMKLQVIAAEDPELRGDIPNIFRREGIRFELAALLHYLFVVTADPIGETIHFVVIGRSRNPEERLAALGALKRDFGETGVGEIEAHEDFL